jgi:hypothetical protein
MPLHLQPEILEESKINTIGSWAFETVVVPDRRLNLLLGKRFGETATLGHKQPVKLKIFHPRPNHITGFKMICEMRVDRLPDRVHPLQSGAII